MWTPLGTPTGGCLGDSAVAPFLCMRLMCSQNEAEVQAVRRELLKAGVRAETRNHPLAESLGVRGIELWVQDERDFYTAANVFARMQAKPGPDPVAAPVEAEDGPPPAPPVLDKCNAQEEPQAPAGNPGDAATLTELNPEHLEQTSSLLQKEIEAMLECETELNTECISLRTKLTELEQALAESQAALAREAESRAVVERTQAQEICTLQSALEGERAQRVAAEEQVERNRMERERAAQQLGRERDQLQQELKAREAALQEAQKRLEGKTQFLRNQEGLLIKLKKDLASLERQNNESHKALAQASAELVLEREARAAAERRAESAAAAQQLLEKQLLDQKLMQQKLQAHWTNLNSLYSKVHAQRAGRAAN